jgi:hypothetical protein
VVYDDSELRPEMLSERDYDALQEVERARPHKLAWFFFGIADDIATGLVLGLTVAIGSCLGIGVAVVSVAASHGTAAMLDAALQLPPLLGLVDFTASKHRHLYPALTGLAFVLASLAWWAVLLATLT